jgi:hypothetical protein
VAVGISAAQHPLCMESAQEREFLNMPLDDPWMVANDKSAYFKSPSCAASNSMISGGSWLKSTYRIHVGLARM